MKKYLLIPVIIIAAGILLSCPTPLDTIEQVEEEVLITEILQGNTPTAGTDEPSDQGESTEPLPSGVEIITPGIGNDLERSQGVFINERNEQIDIISIEDGDPVICVEAVGIVFLEVKETDNPEQNDSTKAVALVIGKRDDGKPGLWEIHEDNSIHPVKIEGKVTSVLPESQDYQDWMMTAFGWEYHVTGISSDGRIVIGYAENTGGFEHRYWDIEEGTTVGVYWYLGKSNSGRIPWVSRAMVVGTPLNSFNHKFGSARFEKRALRWLRFLRRRFQLLFLDWMDNYLTMTSSVELAEEDGYYIIAGPDKNGIDSEALITGRRIISIEPLPVSGEEVDLHPSALVPSDYNAADGENLTVTLTVENTETGTLTGNFDIQLFLSDDPSFDTGDTDAGTFTITEDILGSSSIEITAQLEIPEIDGNECLYIYAVVDSGNSVDETDEHNNTLAKAPAVLVYDDEDGSRTYSINLETFPPTGTVGTNPDTHLYFYDDTSGETMLDWIDENDNGGLYQVDNYSGLSKTLAPGTYYALVMGTSSGPYALSVRLAGMDIRFFEDELTSDPYENDDSYSGHIPDSPVIINTGVETNRYCDDSSDFDWFKIVLP